MSISCSTECRIEIEGPLEVFARLVAAAEFRQDLSIVVIDGPLIGSALEQRGEHVLGLGRASGGDEQLRDRDAGR
jgi:hypothetical protein